MTDATLTATPTGRSSGLNALNLKIIALVFMVIEHFAMYFHTHLPRYSSIIAQYPGRIVAPIFLFLLVESMFHTRSQQRYVGRLWIAAGVMALGNILVSALVRTYSVADPFFPVAQNILITLALAATVIFLWERFKEWTGWQRIAAAVGAVVLSAAMILVEGGMFLLPALYIFYLFRGRKGVVLGLFAAYSVALAVLGWFTNPEYFWLSEQQWAQIATIPFLALYNGKPGRRGFKWLFYIVYPLHIWLFYAIANAL